MSSASEKRNAVDKVPAGDDDRTDDIRLTHGRARRILLKTDLVVMPLAVISMTLAFLDKVRGRLFRVISVGNPLRLSPRMPWDTQQYLV